MQDELDFKLQHQEFRRDLMPWVMYTSISSGQ